MTRQVIALLFSLACASKSTAASAESSQAPGLAADASLGVPKLESEKFSLEGGAAAGYAARQFGLVGRGEYRSFDLAQDNREQTESKVGASGDGWYRFGTDSDAGASLAVSFGFVQYTNDATFFAPFASTEEASQMLRALGGGGGWFKAGDRFSGRIDALVGAQREAYLRTATTGAGALQDEQRVAASFIYDLHVRSRWVASTDLLSLDVLLALEGYKLFRSRALFTYTPGLGFAQQAEVAPANRIEVMARVEAAVLAAKVVGLAPYVYGQAHYLRTSADGTAFAAMVPSTGVGIRTEHF